MISRKMAKKQSTQSSRKISNNKSDKKCFNSLIKVLKPKVYITDSSNFKTLVQELTGNNNNNNHNDRRNPIPLFSPPPIPIQEPVLEIPIFELEENESSSSVDSSEASMPLMAAADSPQQEEVYVSETFNVLENIQKIEHIPNYCDIESWLLQIDDSSCSYSSPDVIIPPTFQQEVSFFYDLSGLIV